MECEYCGSVLSNRRNLTRHQETSKKCLLLRRKPIPNNFVCHRCNKSFTLKYDYDIHLKKHANDKVKIHIVPEETKQIVVSSIDSIINTYFTKEYLFEGQKGVAEFVWKYIAKDMGYYCTDYNRKIFKYGDNLRDPDGSNLIASFYAPLKSKVCDLITTIIRDEDPEDLSYIIQVQTDIFDLSDKPKTFLAHLAKKRLKG